MKPVFNPINYSFEVNEGLGSSGLTIAKVMATDMDEGENSKIVYKIRSGNIGNAFAVHPETVCCTQTLFKYTAMTLFKLTLYYCLYRRTKLNVHQSIRAFQERCRHDIYATDKQGHAAIHISHDLVLLCQFPVNMAQAFLHERGFAKLPIG